MSEAPGSELSIRDRCFDASYEIGVGHFCLVLRTAPGLLVHFIMHPVSFHLPVLCGTLYINGLLRSGISNPAKEEYATLSPDDSCHCVLLIIPRGIWRVWGLRFIFAGDFWGEAFPEGREGSLIFCLVGTDHLSRLPTGTLDSQAWVWSSSHDLESDLNASESHFPPLWEKTSNNSCFAGLVLSLNVLMHVSSPAQQLVQSKYLINVSDCYY